jgi:gas vesicle protein
MKFDFLKLLFVSILIIGVVACGGKKEEEPEQTPEEKVEETMDKVEETAEQIADSTAEMAEEVAEDVKDAADEAEKEVKKAVNRNDYTSTPMPAKVVNLNEIAAGRDGNISKSQAESLVANGQLLAVRNLENDKVYLVYHSNGMYAGKDLVNMAEVERIGILGKAKTVKGVNVIMADKMRPMR